MAAFVSFDDFQREMFLAMRSFSSLSSVDQLRALEFVCSFLKEMQTTVRRQSIRQQLATSAFTTITSIAEDIIQATYGGEQLTDEDGQVSFDFAKDFCLTSAFDGLLPASLNASDDCFASTMLSTNAANKSFTVLQDTQAMDCDANADCDPLLISITDDFLDATAIDWRSLLCFDQPLTNELPNYSGMLPSESFSTDRTLQQSSSIRSSPIPEAVTSQQSAKSSCATQTFVQLQATSVSADDFNFIAEAAVMQCADLTDTAALKSLVIELVPSSNEPLKPNYDRHPVDSGMIHFDHDYNCLSNEQAILFEDGHVYTVALITKCSSSKTTKISQANGVLQCPTCVYSTALRPNFNRHLRIHASSDSASFRKYVCAICLASFKQQSAVQEHIVHVHISSRNFKCGLCNRAFCLKKNLNRHVRLVHQSNKSFACSDCSKRYKTSAHLKRHLLRHI